MVRKPGLADGGQGAPGRIDVHAHYYVPAELLASLPDAPGGPLLLRIMRRRP